MERIYDLIDDGESSVKNDWIGKKPTMDNVENFKRVYKDMEFISTSGRSSQYVEFGKDITELLKYMLGSEYKVETSTGHFEVSGFISRKDKYCYFSTGDLRNGVWYDDILYRTAESNKDFRGGSNRFCSFDELVENIKRLLEV